MMTAVIYAGLPPENRVERKEGVNILRPEEIDMLIESEFNTTIDTLRKNPYGKTGGRDRDTQVIPRQLWQYLLSKHTKLVLKRIGERTNRNHATVIHSIKKVKLVLDFDKDVYYNKFKSIVDKAEKL